MYVISPLFFMASVVSVPFFNLKLHKQKFATLTLAKINSKQYLHCQDHITDVTNKISIV